MRFLAFVLLLILPGYALAKLSGTIDWRILASYVALINLTAYFVFWLDKKRAKAKAWRIPESTLHGLELFGGWPAGLLGQWSFRHKTAKTPYQVVFWLIVVAHQYIALDYVLNWRILESFKALAQ